MAGDVLGAAPSGLNEEAADMAAVDRGTADADDLRTVIREEIQAVVQRISRNEARIDGLASAVEIMEQPLLAEIRRLRQCLSVVVAAGQEGLVGAE